MFWNKLRTDRELKKFKRAKKADELERKALFFESKGYDFLEKGERLREKSFAVYAAGHQHLLKYYGEAKNAESA